MRKIKKFLNNQWTIGIGTGLTVSFIILIINSVIQRISILQSIYSILSLIIKFVWCVLTFGIPVWLLIIVGLTLILILKIIPEPQEQWEKYTLGYYKNWLFEWSYVEDAFGQTRINNLRPVCTKCRCDLSTNYHELYCPKCSNKYYILESNTLSDLEKVIIGNLKTGEYKLIDKKE
jgi:hypothetical protein